MAVALCLASSPVTPISLRLDYLLAHRKAAPSGIDRKCSLAGAGMSGDWRM
jgi:hypothetical protein